LEEKDGRFSIKDAIRLEPWVISWQPGS